MVPTLPTLVALPWLGQAALALPASWPREAVCACRLQRRHAGEVAPCAPPAGTRGGAPPRPCPIWTAGIRGRRPLVRQAVGGGSSRHGCRTRSPPRRRRVGVRAHLVDGLRPGHRAGGEVGAPRR